MLLVTFLWSIAGVVTRHLDSAAAFEVTFWRSASNALALVFLLSWLQGPAALWHGLRNGGAVLWASGACWTVMFTAFMVALTMTSVAHVLITMALAPLFTALMARAWLGQRLPARTWWAIGVAGLGITGMFANEVLNGRPQDLWGMAVALSVPVAGAAMWTLLQHHAKPRPAEQGSDAPTDMSTAILIGAVASALLTLPLAWPLKASAHDIGLLAFLGVVQLAIPCVLAVKAGKVLKAPEAALLGLLEVIMGVAWTWLGASEAPSLPVLLGGALVLLALASNEVLALRSGR
ncbi:DMT family transporter [Ideonella sp.]|uniref:DMT family transporter n=1 Tax=Ideonella sp. TaxID=1929293 RepID=UPI0037C09CF3